MSPAKYMWVKLLAAFAILQKALSCLSVCLSAHPFAWNNSVPTGWIFLKFDIWVFFENLLKKLNFYWNLTEKHLCTWIPMYVYDNISLNSSWNEKHFRKPCRENQNIHFMLSFSSPPHPSTPQKSCYIWDNMEKYERARQATVVNIIRHMRIACWITRLGHALNTPS